MINTFTLTICKKLLDMSYMECVNYFREKYGPVPYDFTNPKNYEVGNAYGLFIHHIDEIEIPGLSSPEYKTDPDYAEYQKADRLVWCNWLEHLLLHIKIDLESPFTTDTLIRHFIPNLFALYEFNLKVKNYSNTYFEIINTNEGYNIFKYLITYLYGQYDIRELRTFVREAQRTTSSQLVVDHYDTIMKNLSHTEEDILFKYYETYGPEFVANQLQDKRFTVEYINMLVHEKYHLRYIPWEEWELDIIRNRKPGEHYEDIAKLINLHAGYPKRSGANIYNYITKKI